MRKIFRVPVIKLSKPKTLKFLKENNHINGILKPAAPGLNCFFHLIIIISKIKLFIVNKIEYFYNLIYVRFINNIQNKIKTFN